MTDVASLGVWPLAAASLSLGTLRTSARWCHVVCASGAHCVRAAWLAGYLSNVYTKRKFLPYRLL